MQYSKGMEFRSSNSVLKIHQAKHGSSQENENVYRWKSLFVILDVNALKEKNYMMTSVEEENTFDEVQQLLMKTFLRNEEYKEIFLTL